MRYKILGVLALVSACMMPSQADAAVFAGHLTMTNNGNGTFNLGYRLNEDANVGVTVRIKDAGNAVVRTIATGVQTKGVHTVLWDGKNDSNVDVSVGNYTWEVEASTNNTGSSDPYALTVDGSARQNSFYSPRGMDSNKNLTSPHFGSVYVTENGPLNPPTDFIADHPDRVTNDGVYMLTNDFEDGFNQGDTGYGGGVSWSTSYSSPFRPAVSQDDKLFICDWTDPHSGIWVMDINSPSNPFTSLFTEGTRDVAGIMDGGLHGSISSMVIDGSGANTVLYTYDEDLPNPGSIWKYPIGTTSQNYSTVPTVEYDDGVHGNLQQNFASKIAKDPKAPNSWWIAQYRSSDTAAVPSLIHYDGTSVDWISANSLPLNGTNAGAMELSADGNRLAIGGAGLRVLDVTDRNNVSIIYSNAPTGTTTLRDIDFDAAGNIMMVTNVAEKVFYYSKQGSNTFVTPSPTNGSIPVSGSAVENWGLYE